MMRMLLLWLWAIALVGSGVTAMIGVEVYAVNYPECANAPMNVTDLCPGFVNVARTIYMVAFASTLFVIPVVLEAK